MKTKIFIVTSVDSSDTANGLPEVQKLFDNKEDALNYIKADMREYCDNYTYIDEETGKTIGPSVYDEDRMFIQSPDETSSCQWNICEKNVEIKFDNSES